MHHGCLEVYYKSWEGLLDIRIILFKTNPKYRTCLLQDEKPEACL
jgi:hypothetical protein